MPLYAFDEAAEYSLDIFCRMFPLGCGGRAWATKFLSYIGAILNEAEHRLYKAKINFRHPLWTSNTEAYSQLGAPQLYRLLFCVQ
jgi:hypothetical protein